MSDNMNNEHRPSGDKYRYVSKKPLSTEDKQRDYYRQLANERAQRPENYRPAHLAEGEIEQQRRRPPTVSRVNASSQGSNPRPSQQGSRKPDGKKTKKKKMGKGKKALISILVILLVLILAVGGTGFYYLNLINFDDGNGTPVLAPTNPEGENEEDDILNGELSADEANSLKDADADINANLDNNEVWYSDQVTNILLLGIDYGGKNYPYGRSDSMIVVSINNASGKIKLISLGRAAYSAIPGYKNTRLSHAHGYGGPELTIQAIQKNYKIRIDNYASVNFDSFEHIIDALGGVTITLTSAEANAIKHLLGTSSAGTYNLNGRQALAYARTRKIDTDRNRTGRQRKVLESLAGKATTMSLTQMIGAMDDVLPYVRTNMSRTQLLGMLSKAMTYLGYSREQYVLPHKSSNLVLRDGFEVVIVDWANEVKYVHELVYGDVEAKIM